MPVNLTSSEIEFDQRIRKKFNVFNSLFLNLPFESIRDFGMLIPVMQKFCDESLEKGMDPELILDSFFNLHTRIRKEPDKIGFMFRVIQYIERQVVLYDSIEDSAFQYVHDSFNEMSLLDYLRQKDNADLQERLLDKLNTFSIRLVFTAHPTQFYPPAILDLISRLKALIDVNDLNGIDLALQQLGMTSFVNSTKPTPYDEAENIIYYLSNVYYPVIGEFYSGIKKNFPQDSFDNPGLVRIGFWPGGDRDGNPFVTSAITLQVADGLRMALMRCYYQDIKALEKKLTFRKVSDLIADLRANLYHAMYDPDKVLQYPGILDPLNEVKDLIIAKYNGLYLDDLEELIDKVTIFRTHFATLDIRQDHRVHLQAVEEILRGAKIINESLNELPVEGLVDVLLHSEVEMDPGVITDPVARDTVMNISQLKTIQQKNGESGCNRYIISNSADIFSVLFVYALFRWSGWNADEITFDIIPLFETMEGMAKAGETMTQLFDIPEYREHLAKRQDMQTIMLGFSDGTKDGGYLKANWSIFKTKEELTGIGEFKGIRIIFFDGRGGPPARGGGKTHRFYASQGPKIANHEIQLTVQGQTITSRYGTREQFLYNCDQLLTAGLSRSIFGESADIPEPSRELLEELSELSYRKYQALKTHPKFLPYLENRSTLKYYSTANIGSRPVRRGDTDKLTLEDLRAISFVGSWSQLKQNVPGYFGIGTAIHEIVERGKLEDLKQLFKDIPYFKALVLNSMMSLTKCNFKLTRYLSRDPEYKDFWKILFDEYRLSREMLLLISGYADLMEEEPVTRNSIRIREQIVLPLLVIQQFALKKARTKSKYLESYRKIVVRSLYGNINASRNSA